MAILQSVLSFAVAEELIEFNPARSVRKPRYERSREPRIFLPAEVEQIRAKLDKLRDRTLVERSHIRAPDRRRSSSASRGRTSANGRFAIENWDGQRMPAEDQIRAARKSGILRMQPKILKTETQHHYQRSPSGARGLRRQPAWRGSISTRPPRHLRPITTSGRRRARGEAELGGGTTSGSSCQRTRADHQMTARHPRPYEQGCRCDACRETKSRRNAQYREQHQTRLPQDSVDVRASPERHVRRPGSSASTTCPILQSETVACVDRREPAGDPTAMFATKAEAAAVRRPPNEAPEANGRRWTSRLETRSESGCKNMVFCRPILPQSRRPDYE